MQEKALFSNLDSWQKNYMTAGHDKFQLKFPSWKISKTILVGGFKHVKSTKG